MQLGVVGLGRMGGNIAKRLIDRGHECVVTDRDGSLEEQFAAAGARWAADLPRLVASLDAPRAVWVMLPAGEVTEGVVKTLSELLSPGDIVIDGGNSFWKDDIRRGQALAQRGLHYVDVGTSGGVWGRERGYCMMIGGDADVVKHLDPLLDALAPGEGTAERTPRAESADTRPERGYVHAGSVGAGHFSKMVHNGIEYGMMQALAEGFDILRNANSDKLPAEHRFDLNVADISEAWRRGSVVSSWLLDLTARALAKDPGLGQFTGSVQDSGEGRWTILAAIDEDVPCDVLAAALFVRFRSRQDHTFAERLLSAMRFQFGGHVEGKGGAHG